jgi:hypothetical protein
MATAKSVDTRVGPVDADVAAQFGEHLRSVSEPEAQDPGPE